MRHGQVGQEYMTVYYLTTVAQIIGGVGAGRLLVSYVREQGQPGSRAGHFADDDVVGCDCFVAFVESCLRPPPLMLWEALCVVRAVVSLYRLAVGADFRVTWQKLEAVFGRLGCKRSDNEAVRAIWRAASSHVGSATLAELLEGVVQGKLAAERSIVATQQQLPQRHRPMATDETALAEAYPRFRALHLRLAAHLSRIATEDMELVTYTVGKEDGLALLEVLQTWSGQPCMVLRQLAGMDTIHGGIMLLDVNGVCVCGMEPEDIQALLQHGWESAGTQKLTFTTVRDPHILGDARFAALLRARTVAEGAQAAIVRQLKRNITTTAPVDELPLGTGVLSKMAQPLVRFVFDALTVHSVKGQDISARLAALAIHCMNHAIAHDVVLAYLQGFGKGDAVKMFAAAGADDDPYSEDEGELHEPVASVPGPRDLHTGKYRVLRPAICRGQASHRSPVTGELAAGELVDATACDIGEDGKVRLCCTAGWFSMISVSGDKLVEVERASAERPRGAPAERMPKFADNISVDMQQFMRLMGAAEKHPSFKFGNLVSGVRELVAASTMFDSMDYHSTGLVTIVEVALLTQDMNLQLTVRELREIWELLSGAGDDALDYSIQFTDFLEGMENLRRSSSDLESGWRFRQGAIQNFGPGSEVDRALDNFISSTEEEVSEEGAEMFLLVKLAFDACDRASNFGDGAGLVSGSTAAMMLHSMVHDIDYQRAARYIQQIAAQPDNMDKVAAFKALHDWVVHDDPYTDDEPEIDEVSGLESQGYTGEYIVLKDTPLYREAAMESNVLVTLQRGVTLAVVEGAVLPISAGKCAGKIRLRCHGVWAGCTSGWVSVEDANGDAQVERRDERRCTGSIVVADTALLAQEDTDRTNIALGTFRQLFLIAQQHPCFDYRHFVLGIREILTAALLFRAANNEPQSRRVGMIHVACLCTELKVVLDADELGSVWECISPRGPASALNFSEFFQGTSKLREAVAASAGGQPDEQGCRKFRKFLLTQDGLGASAEKMVRHIQTMSSQQKLSNFHHTVRNIEAETHSPTKAVSLDPDAAQWMVVQQPANCTNLLIQSAAVGNWQSVRHAIEHGADTAFYATDGRNALLTASMHGHSEVVAELLAVPDMCINAIDFRMKWSALMYAARWGLDTIASMLVDAGADLAIADSADQDALALATDWGHDNVAKRICVALKIQRDPLDGTRDLNGLDRRLLVCSTMGNVNGVLDALRLEANVSARESLRGWTAMITASNYGHTGVVGVLISASANVVETDAHEWSALMYACRWGHVGVATMLLEHSASLDTSVTEVEISEQGSVGISLAAANTVQGQPTIKSLVPGSIASRLPELRRGLVLHQVNDTLVSSLDVAVDLIARSGRPLKMAFTAASNAGDVLREYHPELLLCLRAVEATASAAVEL